MNSRHGFLCGPLRSLRLCVVVPAIALAAACGGNSNGPGSPAPSDSVLALEPVVSGLNVPLYLTAPAGDPRLFIVEKDGLIRVFKNGGLLSTPFLDLTSRTTKGSEQGLLGLAFDPNYAANGRFYVSYTTPGPTGGGTSIIARYHVSSGNPDIADPVSDTLILSVTQPYDNHNGGGIGFGPDGMLYIGFGDGGSGGDPMGTGQDRTDLLGSMLRLDVSGASYTSPADNPYAGNGSFRPELWNYGLRNPWRWSFDRQTGDLYIGDVGQNAYEEVDVQAAGSGGGENYGWSIMEGSHCYPDSASCNRSGLVLPMITYGHNDGCAVTGGYVYRGSAVPAVQGQYFYSDACSGFIRSFRWSGGTISEAKQWSALTISGVNSFGEDSQGELYVMTYDGTLYRFAAPAPAP